MHLVPSKSTIYGVFKHSAQPLTMFGSPGAASTYNDLFDGEVGVGWVYLEARRALYLALVAASIAGHGHLSVHMNLSTISP